MSELIIKLSNLKKRLDKALPLVKIDEKHRRLLELQQQMSQQDFWKDKDIAKSVSQQSKDLENEIRDWEEIKKEIDDLQEFLCLNKKETEKEAERRIENLEKKLGRMETALLFKNKYDVGNAILSIHSGTGGTDAQDWAEMLLRMYLRFCEKRKWQTKIINISSGNEAGIKSVLFEVEGKNVYGYLKAESGVHRLVRISPFDAEKMRHTSFALVEVLPMLDEEIEIQIKSEELRIDTFHASGHGGQSVNTTDSAVRITHLPTEIVVSCQNERSQQQNKETALKILKAKLQRYSETELEEERQRLRGEYTKASWSNQIRSYVLHPYKMVKDHRTEFETSDAEKVLDGELMEFIEAYLKLKIEKSKYKTKD